MKTITTAGAALLMTTSIAAAGGIDRSNQFLGVIFEEGGDTGSYAQFSYGTVSPEANADPLLGGAVTTSDPLQTYSSAGFAYKTQITDQLSAAVIIDEPFGADVEYTSGAFSGTPAGNAQAYIDSTAITAVLRYELDNGFSVHGGMRAQEIGGVIVSAPGLLVADSDYDFGYLVGAAYERPDIALRVALTYNSEIDNVLSGSENGTAIADFTLTTPASWNLEFQTGVAEDTLVFGSIRYAEWDGFNLTANTNQYASFTGNTTTYSVGVGRRLNDNFSVFATMGYEAAGTSPSTTALAPTTGFRSIGLGGTYTMDNMEITGGVTYVVPGDQRVTVGGTTPPGTEFAFNDNSVIGVGLRVGYNF